MQIKVVGKEKKLDIHIKQIIRTIHINPPLNLKRIAEKYAFCEWDPESKKPMRIWLQDNLAKYGVVWFMSPTCIQMKIFSHNNEMVKEINDYVMKIIRKTTTPSSLEKFKIKLRECKRKFDKQTDECMEIIKKGPFK